MKVGIKYSSLEDISNIVWCLKDYNLNKLNNGNFIFSNQEDSYHFIRNNDDKDINYCDLKVKAFHTFDEWKTHIGYDKLIQSQLVENYHYYISNEAIQEYLDRGNISLSSASISFEHKNFYFEPFFNINFFYHFYGMNYLNFYNFDNTKINLIGTYHNLGGKRWRDEMYLKIKNEIGDDFNSFYLKNYGLKTLYEPYDSFGLWGRNHISGYTDYKTSVCNLIFETLEEIPNNEQGTRMYKRNYITEKTTKSLFFCEENIFFIWYGPKEFYEYLIKYGFWFYNSEFYNGSVEESVINAVKELKSLKKKLSDNNKVYDYLLEKHGINLKNNILLFNTMLDTYNKRSEILNLIKYG